MLAPSGVEGAHWLANSRAERREARPAVAQAFDAEGKPTKAAEGWSVATASDRAGRAWCRQGRVAGSHRRLKAVRPEVLGELVASALAKLPIPKMMRWGEPGSPSSSCVRSSP
ncbi:glycine--tRNA ligase subunit beta [Aeromonas dhakensis]|uniref:glycine--tRNA ligase subunit beta n=1 Tax=Aeromonas dhakensis TaxID=196024 RepID=UPI00342D20E4